MKKIISMILAFAMCTACLTACGDSSSESPSSDSSIIKSELESYPLTVEAATDKAFIEAYDEIEKQTVHVLDNKEIISGHSEDIKIANAYCERADRMQHNDGKEFICYKIRITGHYTCEDIYGYSHLITIDYTREVNDDGSKHDLTEKTIDYDIKISKSSEEIDE